MGKMNFSFWFGLFVVLVGLTFGPLVGPGQWLINTLKYGQQIRESRSQRECPSKSV